MQYGGVKSVELHYFQMAINIMVVFRWWWDWSGKNDKVCCWQGIKGWQWASNLRLRQYILAVSKMGDHCDIYQTVFWESFYRAYQLPVSGCTKNSKVYLWSRGVILDHTRKKVQKQKIDPGVVFFGCKFQHAGGNSRFWRYFEIWSRDVIFSAKMSSCHFLGCFLIKQLRRTRSFSKMVGFFSFTFIIEPLICKPFWDWCHFEIDNYFYWPILTNDSNTRPNTLDLCVECVPTHDSKMS